MRSCAKPRRAGERVVAGAEHDELDVVLDVVELEPRLPVVRDPVQRDVHAAVRAL